MNRLLALGASLAALTAGAPALAQDMLITNAKVVVGDGSAPIDGASVLVRGGRVVAAGRNVAVPQGVEVRVFSTAPAASQERTPSKRGGRHE